VYSDTNGNPADANTSKILSSTLTCGSQNIQSIASDPDTIMPEWISSDIDLTDDNEDEVEPNSPTTSEIENTSTPSNIGDPAINALQQLYGRTATWRDSFQQDLTKSSLQLRPHEGMLAILPTGYGKSLLFLIPTIMEPHMVTVVFVPLRALIDDIASSIRLRGIHCTIWGEQKTNNPVVKSLLLVSMDTYGSSEALRLFISRLEWENRLGRVVLDEVHLILSAEYRVYKLQKIRGIKDRQTPIILLTATLPPDMEAALLQLLCFDTNSSKTWRLPSQRFNVRYLLERPTDDKIAWELLTGIDQDPTVDGWFNRWSGYLATGEKGIIFCVTKDEVENIANHLRIPAYHSALPLMVRQKNLKSWTTGTVSWIVGTSGLGAGIDIPNVKVVVHWGIPSDILDWVQMSGRGVLHPARW